MNIRIFSFLRKTYKKQLLSCRNIFLENSLQKKLNLLILFLKNYQNLLKLDGVLIYKRIKETVKKFKFYLSPSNMFRKGSKKLFKKVNFFSNHSYNSSECLPCLPIILNITYHFLPTSKKEDYKFVAFVRV